MNNNAAGISLEDLYENCKKSIYSLCIKLTLSEEKARNLFSATWVRAAEKFDQLDSAKNAHNWVYTICLNLYRHSIRKPWVVRLFAAPEECDEVGSSLPDAEQRTIEEETKIQIQRALNALPDKYRIPIILFYYKDFSYQKIADIMQLNMSTVKFRLNHAKKLLKLKLEDDEIK